MGVSILLFFVNANAPRVHKFVSLSPVSPSCIVSSDSSLITETVKPYRIGSGYRGGGNIVLCRKCDIVIHFVISEGTVNIWVDAVRFLRIGVSYSSVLNALQN